MTGDADILPANFNDAGESALKPAQMPARTSDLRGLNFLLVDAQQGKRPGGRRRR